MYRYGAVMVVFLIFLIGNIGCTLPPVDQSGTAEIIKSDNDQREYKFVQLPNKLRVLLISDVNTDKAAASLDVYAGSRQDPHAYQGLAHFLEHMLFLGTKKYPEAGEYQAFINNHNGAHNAYTSFEHTNYFFDINPAHLDEALDRFSQFFIAPLFTEAYVEREKNAVHSEYMAKIKSDQRKALDVFKSVVNPKHAFAKFSVGNLDTLATVDQEHSSLQDQLVRFYTHHYSANVMALVVLGRESLQELEVMVNTKFAAIVNTDKQVAAIEEPLFTAGTLPLSVTVRPEKEQRVLSFVFSTEEQTAYYQQKPLQYIGNIIGHEGKGSLLSYLKKQGLAERLSAGSGLSYKGGGNFSIMIELTEKGLTQTDHIINSVFQTINRIKTSGATHWLFDEQRSQALQQFRYLEQSTPINYVSRIASNLHYYPASQVLSGPYLMNEFDAPLIKRFLSYLDPDNVVVTLSAPDVAVDKISHFYGTHYQAKPVTKKALDTWRRSGLNPQITLPEPNEFIADDFQLKTSDKVQLKPDLISDKDGLQLWFKHDEHFQVPRGNVIFSVRSPISNDTVVHSVLLEMFTRMVEDELNEFSYPALLAGLNYSVASHSRGFSVKIAGFNDKQPLLLNKILHVLTSPTFDQQRFDNIKQNHIRQLENTRKQQPYKLLMRQLPQLLYRNRWSEKQLLSVYQSISLQDLRSYAVQLLSEVDTRVLVYGNYAEKQAKQLGKTIAKALVKNTVSAPVVDVIKLSEQALSHEMASDYSDASLLFYLQAESIDKNSRAAMGVVAHWLRSDFYTQLRTEKQLGYVVMAGAYPVIDIPGMIFMIQSPVAGHAVLQQEINQFIQQKSQEIDTLPESVFNQHRQALIQRLSESAKNMWEQSNRYWQDITQGYGQFDSREQLVRALKNLTFEQWRLFFREQIANPQRRGLLIYSVGQFTNQVLVETRKIDNITQFKAKADYYQFP